MKSTSRGGSLWRKSGVCGCSLTSSLPLLDLIFLDDQEPLFRRSFTALSTGSFFVLEEAVNNSKVIKLVRYRTTNVTDKTK